MRFPCDIFERQLARLPLLQQRVVSIAAYLLGGGGGEMKQDFDLQEFPPVRKIKIQPINTVLLLN